MRSTWQSKLLQWIGRCCVVGVLSICLATTGLFTAVSSQNYPGLLFLHACVSQTDGMKDKHRDREAETETEPEGQRCKHVQTHRHRHTHTQTQTHTHTQTYTHTLFCRCACSGGHALQWLHHHCDDACGSSTMPASVHICNLAAQTGVSRFGQSNPHFRCALMHVHACMCVCVCVCVCVLLFSLAITPPPRPSAAPTNA